MKKANKEVKLNNKYLKEPKWIICKWCGKRHLSIIKNEKFCSDECRKERKYYLMNKRDLPAICAVCEKKFLTSLNCKSATCSDECRDIYRGQLISKKYWAKKDAAFNEQKDCLFENNFDNEDRYEGCTPSQLNPFG